MKRRPARPNAYAKNQLHSMIEKGDIAGLILALFSIVVVKIIATLLKVLCGLLKEIGNLVVAMTYTTIFAIQLTVARHRALQGNDQRIRWFGRASILRAADILVFARCWPLVPNTFVARQVLKVASKAAIIGLQSGDLTEEEARIWIARIKQQTVPQPAQVTDAQSHPLYVKVRRPSRQTPDVYITSSSAGSAPPLPHLPQRAKMSLEDAEVTSGSDEAAWLIDEEPGETQQNRMVK
jgi:hypothetical protein